MITDMKQKNNALLFEGMISLRALLEASKSNFNNRRILKLFYAEERLSKQKKEYAFLCHRAEEQGFEIELCTKNKLSSLAVGNSHGGVLALCSAREFPVFQTKQPEKQGFYVMMEGIEDPYNFGYALRSVYAAGADGIILSGGKRDGADSILCRSSAGASERLPIYLSEPEECIDLLRSVGYKIIAADLPNSKVLYDADLKKPLLLVIGGEKRGITASVLEKCDEIVRIDYGRDFAASLSAASAAAVLAFEVYRQNR